MITDQLDTYLSRIGYDGPVNSSVVTLARLQRLHMQAIPFENFDVYLGRRLDLSTDALYRKMIVGKRGGYCFELNTLYADLLRSFGFAPRPVLGRVLLREPKDTPPRNHLAHLVQVDGGQTYLTDVGFGGLTTRVPLCLDPGQPVNDGEGLVRLNRLQEAEYVVERQTAEGWKQQYSFETLRVHPSDIMLSNHFTETHSTSHFLHGRFIGLFTKEGRVGLYENQFTERVGSKVTIRQEVADGPGWLAFVEEQFGVELKLSDVEIGNLTNQSSAMPKE